MITARPCLKSDKSFVYELTRQNIAYYFIRNTQEGWSDEKFQKGFDPAKITIIERDAKPIGFYDIETVLGNPSYLYIRNCEVVDGKRGVGITLNRLVDEEARKRNLCLIKAKVFKNNSRALLLFRMIGYHVVEDRELALENSVYIEKRIAKRL